MGIFTSIGVPIFIFMISVSVIVVITARKPFFCPVKLLKATSFSVTLKRAIPIFFNKLIEFTERTVGIVPVFLFEFAKCVIWFLVIFVKSGFSKLICRRKRLWATIF